MVEVFPGLILSCERGRRPDRATLGREAVVQVDGPHEGWIRGMRSRVTVSDGLLPVFCNFQEGSSREVLETAVGSTLLQHE